VSAVTAVAAADLAASSNEAVVYSGVFGNDVIVNFAATGPGIDALDFTALNGTTVTAAFTTDKSINVATAASLVIPTGSTDVAAIATLYNANNAAAQNHVYVSVNTSNVGTVYTVADPVGATNAVATLAGTIDLGDPAMANWLTLTTANFVNAGGSYYLTNGPTGLNSTGGAVVVPGGPVAAAVTVNAAAAVVETAATNTTYTVATPASSFVYSIAGFGAGDKIVSPAGVAASLTNGSFTDGTATVQYATGGNVVQITLTGLTNAQDGALFAATDLNTVFGAGTFA